MVDAVGQASLVLTLAAGAGGIAAATAAAATKSTPLLRAARLCAHAVAALLSFACVWLLAGFLNDDFGLACVAGYSEQAMPVGFKVAAFWAGQEGSLLLWAWLVGLCGAMAVRTARNDPGRQQSVLTGVLLACSTFFAALLLWAANPFTLVEMTPVDGQGLNPLLQDLAMILHPPVLFVGYAGFTVPLALTAAALAAGKLDGLWLARVRQWVLGSWIFLTAGIVLGAQWAYIELGWGGYWGWDPVENASLLPWFTSTALFHTLIIQRARQTLKWWNAGLVGASFLLCIFATYLTRSGVISSVHAFPKSAIGWFFLAFLVVGSAAWVALCVWRRGLLAPALVQSRLASRERAVLAGAVLLVLMLLGTAYGTLYPILSLPFSDHPQTLGPPYYNQLILPLALAMAAVMALAPVLPYGRGPLSLGRLAAVAGTAMAAALAAGLITGSLWMIASAAAAGAAIATALVELGRMLFQSPASLGTQKRRIGAVLAHAGLGIVIIGVAGSSLFPVEQTLPLTQGQVVNLGRHRVRLEGVREVPERNFVAVEAQVTLLKADGSQKTLRPQRRFYNKKIDQPNTEVAVHTTLREDVYMTLSGWDNGGRQATVHAFVRPLVIWIWIGSLLLTLAAILCMTVRLGPSAAADLETFGETTDPAGASAGG